MNTSNPLRSSLVRAGLITGALLLIPFIGSLFTGEINWSPFDYVIAGILLFGACSAYFIISGLSGNLIYKVAIGLALASGLFLIWANLAVGIIGSENNAYNSMYFGVALVLIISSFIARFRAKGMAVALFVTAFAQAFTIIVALSAGLQHTTVSSAYEIILINGLFITLFCISGGLFLQINDKRKPGETRAISL